MMEKNVKKNMHTHTHTHTHTKLNQRYEQIFNPQKKSEGKSVRKRIFQVKPLHVDVHIAGPFSRAVW